MLTSQDARVLSKTMSEPDMFPEAREQFTRTLFDYYKELLESTKVLQIPTPRRMW
jgi:hypothetical protein